MERKAGRRGEEREEEGRGGKRGDRKGMEEDVRGETIRDFIGQERM